MSDAVGNSEFRTKGKHGALDAILGKTVGVMTARFQGLPLVMIDCTAGDGQGTEHSNTTSPSILHKHSEYAKAHGIDTSVIMYERSIRSGEMLFEKYGQHHQVYAGQDSREMPKHWTDDAILFVSNDPNTVADWALPASLSEAPAMTTVFSTLGCNAGGLKRLNARIRAEWFSQVNTQLSLLQHWHDAYLVMLEGDSAQWAYLVNAPQKWIAETETAFARAFRNSPYPLRGAWFKRQNNEFSAMCDWLFMTRKEFAEVHGYANLNPAAVRGFAQRGLF
jgi:hypothetical protein